MKNAILGPVFYLMFIFITLYSCELLNSDEMKNFIPGTYTRHYNDDYTNSYDTIQIRLTSNDIYLVTKKSSYNKINDQGNWISGFESKKWTGTYDKKTGTIFLTPGGKRIFFETSKKELKIGTEPYKKLEQ